MATADEAATARTPLGAALKAGLDVLDLNESVTFNLYVRLVMPLDGYVFWVRSTLLSVNPQQADLPQSITVMGSVHNVAEQRQTEDDNYATTRIIFSSQGPVTNLAAIGPDHLYVGFFNGSRFAFSSRSQWYQQANLWHYVGQTVNSVMVRQLIDDPADIQPDNLIVSNSLPGWLALNIYRPVYPVPLPAPAFQMYPSFLSPLNYPGKYATVHIEPTQTVAQQSVPYLDDTMSHFQLAQDHVQVDLWGCNNDLAQAWIDNVIQYTLDVGAFGLVNMPIVQDDKRQQVEFLAIAQKKSVVFDVSYNQYSIRNVARQLILSAFMTIYANDVPIFPIPIPIP